MKLGILTASLSHDGGGVYEAVRRSAQELHRGLLPNLEVLGLEDERLLEDLPTWEPIRVTPCSVRGLRSFGYAPDMANKLREAQIDLLHVHGLWMYPSLASLRWAQKWKKPYIITTHGMLDSWAVRRSRWRKYIAAKLYERHHLNQASCLHALCGSELRSIRTYGLQNPVCVLPFGVDIPEPSSIVRDGGKQERTILFLGRLHPKKNLVRLLQAWQKVHRAKSGRESGWVLTIAGWDQGGHERNLRILSGELGLEATVRFVGPKFGADKAALLSEADAFVLPSVSEGLPISVLEAWSYGLPVLMTPECNIPEGFQTEAAISMKADVESITHGLTELLAMSEDERICMGIRGRQLVQKSFSWTAYTTQMHAVYLWLLGSGDKPDCVVEA